MTIFTNYIILRVVFSVLGIYYYLPGSVAEIKDPNLKVSKKVNVPLR